MKNQRRKSPPISGANKYSKIAAAVRFRTINIENSVENTDLKSGSDGIETEHLQCEGLVQTGDENWEHQVS